jgi:hypothetical protein
MNGIYNARSINDIYKIFKANYNFNIADFRIKKVPVSIFDKFKDELLTSSNKYLNYEFAHNYMTTCKNCYHITYNIDSRDSSDSAELNMYIMMRTKITKKMKAEVFKNLYRVYLVSKIYDISKSGNYKFNYYIIMNPKKRFMPTKKGELIDVININGGFTYINKNEIFIIRKEDYNKVIIHELLHHNVFIHRTHWDASNIRRLKAHFNICNDMLLIPNETLVETYACVLNTIFYSLETKTSLKENFRKDQEHSIQLTKRILERQNGKKWNEKTHSYCYIVFKTILYVYFNLFLKIYKYHNDTEITDFIIKYSHNIYKKINNLKHIKKVPKLNTNGLKQTIY